MNYHIIDPYSFFDDDPRKIAKKLLGKVLAHKVDGIWLKARIIDVEAYLLEEKGSHASLGFTEKRGPLFAKPGTIYMYYARGGDSFNTSCRGEGNAVLFKTAFPYIESHEELELMQRLNPLGARTRSKEKLCKGQTLLCKSLALKVPDWTGKDYKTNFLELRDYDFKVKRIVKCKRLGIPRGRDEDLMYRYVEYDYRKYSTKNPIARKSLERTDYEILQ